MGPEHYGDEKRGTAQERADGMVAEELKEAEVDGADSGTKAQGRREEGADSAAIVQRNHDDCGLDRATVADGNQSASGALIIVLGWPRVKDA